jgi:hypothetical protein
VSAPTRRPSFRRVARIGIAFVLALPLVGVGLLAGPGLIASAQETDLPGVPADSVSSDFLRGSGAVQPPALPVAPAAPGTPASPVAPAEPVAPDAPSEMIVRRKIHGGDNDVVQVGKDVVVERGEHVLGNVVAMGGDVTVRGMVEEDVVALGGDVEVEDGAVVRGDAVSIGGVVNKAPAATVAGSTVTVGNLPRGLFAWQGLNLVGQGVKFMTRLITLCLWMLIAWIMIMVLTARSARVVKGIEEHPGPALGWGLLGLICIVPATITVALVAALLCVTIIGIPVAVFLLLGYIVGLVLLMLWGGVVGSAAAGGWLVRRLSPRLGEPSLVRNTLVGVVAVSLPGLIAPVFAAMLLAVPPAALLGGALGGLGKLLELGVLLAGMGGILRARAGQIDPWRVPWGGAGPGWAQPPVAPTAPPVPPAPPQAPDPTVAQP